MQNLITFQGCHTCTTEYSIGRNKMLLSGLVSGGGDPAGVSEVLCGHIWAPGHHVGDSCPSRLGVGEGYGDTGHSCKWLLHLSWLGTQAQKMHCMCVWGNPRTPSTLHPSQYKPKLLCHLPVSSKSEVKVEKGDLSHPEGSVGCTQMLSC